MSSAFGISRKLYVIDPICTPLNLESIFAPAESGRLPSTQDAGSPASVSLPNSRREKRIELYFTAVIEDQRADLRVVAADANDTLRINGNFMLAHPLFVR